MPVLVGAPSPEQVLTGAVVVDRRLALGASGSPSPY
jgi:hypothetical protein